MGMRTYILSRILLTIPTLFGISVVAFLTIHLIPGNVVEVMLGTRSDVTPQQIAQLNSLYGIDKPLWQQYGLWAGNILHGDLGFSLRTGLPVTTLLGSALSVTGELTLLAILIGLAIALPLGMISAVRSGGFTDAAGRMVSLLALSIPTFWLGTLLILFVSFYIPWLSTFSFVPFFDNPLKNLQIMHSPRLYPGPRLKRHPDADDARRHARCAGQGLPAYRPRQRSAVHSRIDQACPAQCTPPGRHPGWVADRLPRGGSRGSGKRLYPAGGRSARRARDRAGDYPLVQSIVFVVAALVILINLLVDLCYAWIDPRIRYS